MTLREELMAMLEKRVDLNRENAAAQAKGTVEGAQQALAYLMRAEAAEALALHIHVILQRHGQ